MAAGEIASMQNAAAGGRAASDEDARALAENFNIKRIDAAFLADPFPTYRALREYDPVHLMPDSSYFLARYDDCLKTQVSESPVTAATIMAKFREAMTTCGSVRDFAVAEVTKALIAKGWDEATRARAAASTFAKVDESWLAMGRQYQEALLQKAAGAAGSAAAKPSQSQRSSHSGKRSRTSGA